MNIALDYDNTYTRDPRAWDLFIGGFRSIGHKVYLVTLRHTDHRQEVVDALTGKVDGMFFTSGIAKQNFMYSHGINIDVWIDDSPYFIINNDKTIAG